MPRRNPILANGEIYHVFNRSVGKELIFTSKRNLSKIFEIINYYRFPQKIRLSKFKSLPKDQRETYKLAFNKELPLIEIYAYSFMPNHYHLLLKQTREQGIVRFVSNCQNSFAKYFNIKNSRDGTLLQNSFKAKRVENDEQFIHISKYIHLNPVTSYIINVDDLTDYPWTSFIYYARDQESEFINQEYLLNFFKCNEDYIELIRNQSDYQRELASIKDLILE
ncbi:MAG: transposase [bacterium]|nr:transposase [bacterium]